MNWPARKYTSAPRWFMVVATKTVNSDSMHLDARVHVEVLAVDKQDAMKRVRPEFKHWHLEVL